MKVLNYDTMVFMHPSLVCNFKCVYCGQHNNRQELIKDLDIKKIINRLDELDKTLLVSLCGGEPFLIPNFIEFVRQLTKKHYVRIDSNLSLTQECRKFTSTIDPGKITEIVFSTHVLEREKRKIDPMELVETVHEFQRAGFKVVGNYVVYPPLLKRLEKDMDFFASQGIPVLPSMYAGKFDGKIYPHERGVLSYDEKEFELITRFNPYAKLPLCSTENELCQAGCTTFCVTADLEVFPCYSLHTNHYYKLGDFFGEWKIFPGVIRCPVMYCIDHYNKTFNCSLDRSSLGHLFLKTISEKGTCSRLQFALTREGSWQKLLIGKARRTLKDIVKRVKKPGTV